MTRVVILLCLLLSGCGEDWGSYEKPAKGGKESDWHACMRQHDPIHRNVCRDLK